MPETVLITEEDRRKVLAQYNERMLARAKALTKAVSVERTDARMVLLQFGRDLTEQFGPDGIKDFAIAWANQAKLSAEMKPGHKDTLVAFRDMAKIILNIQKINLDNIPDNSELSDSELESEIQAAAMQAMLEASDTPE